MLELTVPALRGGLQIALLLALMYAYAATSGQRELLRPLRLGGFLGVAGGLGLAYAVGPLLEREVVEGTLSLVAALAAFVLTLRWGRDWLAARGEATRPIAGNGRSTAVLVMVSVTSLLALTALDTTVALVRTYSQDAGLAARSVASALEGATVGLALAAAMGVLLAKVAARVSPRWTSFLVVVALLALGMAKATTAVQVMLVRGLIPLTDWLFTVMVALVNNYWAFQYALLGAALCLALAALWQSRRWSRTPQEATPAQRRKMRAGSRRTRTLLASLAVLTALAAAVLLSPALATTSVYDPKPVPVSAKADYVSIPIASLQEGKLFKFTYEREGIAVNFLAVQLQNGNVQVGLDACQICGAQGYMQEGEYAICKSCRSPIDMITLGFGGGCNPLPLDYTVTGDSILIPATALEAAVPVFQ